MGILSVKIFCHYWTFYPLGHFVCGYFVIIGHFVLVGIMLYNRIGALIGIIWHLMLLHNFWVGTTLSCRGAAILTGTFAWSTCTPAHWWHHWRMSVQIPKSFSFPLIAPSSMYYYYTYYSTDTARRTNNMMGRAYITTGPTEGHWWGAKYGIVWYI